MNIVLHWPQIVWLILLALNLLGSGFSHGKNETRNFVKDTIRLSVVFILLWCGGFFTGGA